jgi:methyl-accepting chemotaxis protein
MSYVSLYKPKLEPCQKLVRYAGASSFIVLSLLLGVLAWQAAFLPSKVSNEVTLVKKDVLSRLDAVGDKLDVRDKQVGALLEHADNYLNSDDVLANLETTTVILKTVSDIVTRVDKQTLPQVETLFSNAGQLLKGIQADADKLTDDATPLKTALTNVATLLESLNQQVKEGGPQVAETAKRLQQVLADTDKLLADPKLTETLSNVDDTTKNISETTKSVDIYLRPLRAKFSLLKTAINKALDMVKFTVPVF